MDEGQISCLDEIMTNNLSTYSRVSSIFSNITFVYLLESDKIMALSSDWTQIIQLLLEAATRANSE